MEDVKLSAEQELLIVQAIKKRKPYLLRLEEEVQQLQHGCIELKVDVRNGSVDKLTFTSHRTWIKEKDSNIDSNPIK